MIEEIKTQDTEIMPMIVPLFMDTNGVRSSLDIDKLAMALSKAQGEIEHAKKKSSNPFFKSKYAELDEVIDVCKESLAKHELSVAQFVGGSQDLMSVTTRLMHSSGQWMESSMSAQPKKADIQGQGTVITYMRRYALAAIVGIAQTDDDGNEGSGIASEDEIKSIEDALKGADAVKAQLVSRYKMIKKIPKSDVANVLKYIEDIKNESR